MDLEFAFLCDYADLGNNKLHAMGIGIDTLYLESVPSLHPGFVAVVSIRFQRTEIGEKPSNLVIMGPDGEIVAKADGTLSVKSGHGPGNTSIHRLIVALRPIPIQRFGPYSVRCVVNGQEIANIPFQVVKQRENDRESNGV
ncbi:MAG TPA: hypothetical protein ENN56_00460 [Firmicutes bacterium]|nr:hypothetical protein [Bacillota bacterium]